MPPAPTTPMMVAERVLDSKKYSVWLAITGRICGMTPNRMAARRPPPLAVMPSTGRRSAVSIASENSLASAPASDAAIARTPAKGPRPTTPIQINAQISVSTLRTVSRLRRVKNVGGRVSHDVAGGKETERDGEERGEQGAEEGDRQGLAEGRQIEGEMTPGRGWRHEGDDGPEIAEPSPDAGRIELKRRRCPARRSPLQWRRRAASP